MAESWKKLKTSNVVSSLNVCSNQNRSALVGDLLSYNSLFVGQTRTKIIYSHCALVI